MERRVGLVTLTVVAAVLAQLGVFSKRWVTLSDPASDLWIEVGLRDYALCSSSGLCRRSEDVAAVYRPLAVGIAGNVAFVGGLLAAALGAGAAFLQLGGRRALGRFEPAPFAAVFFVTAILAAGVFLYRVDNAHTSLGKGGPLAIGGSLLGAIGCVLLARRRT